MSESIMVKVGRNCLLAFCESCLVGRQGLRKCQDRINRYLLDIE